MIDTHYLVIHVQSNHVESTIGEVAINEAGVIELVSASTEQRDYLADWVAKLNSRKEFSLKVAPPPGAPMLSTYGRIFTRGQPNFMDDLKAYVRQLYGIKLLTPGELSQELEDLGNQGL
jgi:hypothetical protein